MSNQQPRPLDQPARARRLEMQHSQAIEGNPLTAAEIEMFEMFEREAWSPERRRAHILALFARRMLSPFVRSQRRRKWTRGSFSGCRTRRRQ